MTRRFLLLLGLAVLGVILNHSATFGFQAMFDLAWRYRPEVAAACGDLTPPVNCPNYDAVGSASYWALSLVRRAIAFGVPAFLMVSGYFIAFAAGRKNPKVNWPVLKSRLIGLIIPYLIWSIIIFVGQAVVYRRVYPGVGAYLIRLLTGGATGAYYYIPLLVQMYLLSPLLVPMAKNSWKWLLLVTAVIQIAVEGLRYFALFNIGPPILIEQLIRWTPLWFFPRRIFWFALGIVFGFHISSFKPVMARYKNAMLAGTLVFYVASLIEFELLLRIYQQLTGREWLDFYSTFTTTVYAGLFMLTFLAFSKLKLPYSAQITDLGTKAFGIYLIHEQVLELVGTLMFRFTPSLLGIQILYQPIMIVTSLAVPLLLMHLVSRSPAKKYYKYLFG